MTARSCGLPAIPAIRSRWSGPSSMRSAAATSSTSSTPAATSVPRRCSRSALRPRSACRWSSASGPSRRRPRRARAFGSPRRALACVLRERLLPADLQLLEDAVDDPELAGSRGERAGGQLVLRSGPPRLSVISETTPMIELATHSSDGWTIAEPAADRYVETCRLVLAALLERPGADWRRLA